MISRVLVVITTECGHVISSCGHVISSCKLVVKTSCDHISSFFYITGCGHVISSCVIYYNWFTAI